MKSFLARMSFPRAVILFCSLGSLVLGTLVYLRSQRLTEVEQELRKVKEIVAEIQADAYRLDALQDSDSKDAFSAQSEPEFYIRAIATDEKVNMGQMDTTKSTKSPAKGIEDTTFKITPQTKSQRFTRGQIGNFLFKLENDSRRVKVTRVKLTPYEKISPGEIGKDQWNLEADLTTRTKLDGGPSDQG